MAFFFAVTLNKTFTFYTFFIRVNILRVFVFQKFKHHVFFCSNNKPIFALLEFLHIQKKEIMAGELTVAQRPMMPGGIGATEITKLRNGATSGNGIIVDTRMVQNNINRIVQFDIDNTGVGASAQKLRIGSLASRPDYYSLYDLQPGASDDGVIEDNFGVGCLKVRGFSELVCAKPVIIGLIKIISTDTLQLSSPISYKSLQYDGTLDTITQATAFTREKSDQQQDLLVVPGAWVLDSQQYLELDIRAGVSLVVMLEIIAANTAEIIENVV